MFFPFCVPTPSICQSFIASAVQCGHCVNQAWALDRHHLACDLGSPSEQLDQGQVLRTVRAPDSLSVNETIVTHSTGRLNHEVIHV